MTPSVNIFHGVRKGTFKTFDDITGTLPNDVVVLDSNGHDIDLKEKSLIEFLYSIPDDTIIQYIRIDYWADSFDCPDYRYGNDLTDEYFKLTNFLEDLKDCNVISKLDLCINVDDINDYDHESFCLYINCPEVIFNKKICKLGENVYPEQLGLDIIFNAQKGGN